MVRRIALGLAAAILAGACGFAADEVPRAPEPLRPPADRGSRLRLPPDLPGAEAPPIRLPPIDPAQPKARAEAVRRLYPPLPEPAPLPAPAPSPTGQPLTLDELQAVAAANSPVLPQAEADVRAARGTALQAGLWPNPVGGYQADTVRTGDTRGYQGVFLSQEIITAGKRRLARAAAEQDVAINGLSLRRARADLAAQVRGGYFAVLVAQERMRALRALVQLADETYLIQVELMVGAQAANYEPMQLRVLAMQARGSLFQAYNRYTAAWKQLAATLGVPGMPPTYLAGRADMTLPVFDFAAVLDHAPTRHTDLAAAEAAIERSRLNLALARRTPIPNVNVNVVVQKDYTTDPFNTTYNLQVGVPIPVFDRNQGHILRVEAELHRAEEEVRRVRNDLSARVAEAFERYDTNRRLVAYYRDSILPDQVRAYRGVYDRHRADPDAASFGDVVTAQQTLAASVTAYVDALGALWTAVVDLSQLLQNEDGMSCGEW